MTAACEGIENATANIATAAMPANLFVIGPPTIAAAMTAGDLTVSETAGGQSRRYSYGTRRTNIHVEI